MVMEICKVATGPDLEYAIVVSLALECFLTPKVLIFLPRMGYVFYSSLVPAVSRTHPASPPEYILVGSCQTFILLFPSLFCPLFHLGSLSFFDSSIKSWQYLKLHSLLITMTFQLCYYLPCWFHGGLFYRLFVLLKNW